MTFCDPKMYVSFQKKNRPKTHSKFCALFGTSRENDDYLLWHDRKLCRTPQLLFLVPSSFKAIDSDILLGC